MTDYIAPASAFSEVSAKMASSSSLTSTPTSFDYINVVRTDARFSTRVFRHNLVIDIMKNNPGCNQDALETEVKDIVHSAYADWGAEVLEAMQRDSLRQNTDESGVEAVKYHLHDAKQLSSRVVENAHLFDERAQVKPTLVSLDDIISSMETDLQDIAFSRLFSLDGRSQYGYVARPGYKNLEIQFQKLKNHIDERCATENVSEIPLVLLEDNVRHARMLNWLFEQMEENGVLNRSQIIGISSCFCCASIEERNKLVSKGKIVPVTSVVDYNGAKVDVVTPRDLLFDGFVVDVNDKKTRLPGIFMDVKKLFNIEPEAEKRFMADVMAANVRFCKKVEEHFDVVVPVSYFAVSDAVCHVAKVSPHHSMAGLMNDMMQSQAPMVCKTHKATSHKINLKPFVI